MKFWVFSILLLATGLYFLQAPGEEINFTDLETECIEDRGEEVTLTKKDGQLYISGHFPVESPRAEMGYDYRKTGDTVSIDIKASGSERPNYRESCDAAGVYEAYIPLEGLYWVEISHQGEQVHRSRIRF